MALTKVTTKGITDSAVTTDKIAPANVTTAKIGPSAVESSEINDGTVTASDLASTLDLSSKTVTLPPNATSVVDQNIALLGFKMAVNDGLTIFNLVAGVVDEFHAESGTDEAEGSNDLYNCSSDYYINSSTPDGSPTTPISAGFSLTAVTEPQTSTAGNNPAYGEGAMASFTVPACISAVDIAVWGAGGGFASRTSDSKGGAGGGYAEGTLAVTASQTLNVIAGEGGNSQNDNSVEAAYLNGGGNNSPGGPSSYYGAGGGGLAGVFASNLDPLSSPQYSAPQAYVIAGSGGGASNDHEGGAGGGLTGGQASDFGGPFTFSNCAAADSGGGGGSSYYGHPQITSGSTEAGAGEEGGGVCQTNYQSSTNEGVNGADGEDGYVFITVSQAASTTSTTIISNAFTSTSVPTTSRIVVFEENVDTPTLNTDVIASISRDGGSTFTTATLSDSGYVTGSSGQRILTGTATISGQPSGQSMRWKLALANNTVKIHGVALQWS